jgi:hypothetical protein
VVELVSVGRPGADDGSAFAGEELIQLAERVNKLVRVAFLIAKANQGDGFAVSARESAPFFQPLTAAH